MKFIYLSMFLAAIKADEFVTGMEPCFSPATTAKSNCTSTCFPNCT
jgi:hypothetical protein